MSVRLGQIVPPRTDRILLAGQTGSGKTTLARYLLNYRKYKIVADYKGKIGWEGYRVYTTIKKLTKASEPALIYRPSYAESIDDDARNRFFEWVYRRGNTTLYVDETAAITEGNTYPYYYGAILMRGRELNVELWSATQRPKDIPQIVLSESEHVYCFRLRLEQDREKIERLAGIPREYIEALQKRNFLYSPQDGEIVGPLSLQIAA